MNEHNGHHAPVSNFDALVGNIAGGICMAFLEIPALKGLCLALTPGVTLKVKQCLNEIPNLHSLSADEQTQLVKKIERSLIPLFNCYDIDMNLVVELSPRIEKSIAHALRTKI